MYICNHDIVVNIIFLTMIDTILGHHFAFAELSRGRCINEMILDETCPRAGKVLFTI